MPSSVSIRPHSMLLNFVCLPFIMVTDLPRLQQSQFYFYFLLWPYSFWKYNWERWTHRPVTLVVVNFNYLFLILECEFGLWGINCTNKCECSDEGSVTCDKVRACVCKPGYTGNSCEVDIDECEQNPNICGYRQQCLNTVGSYACTCRPGFTLTGLECIGTLGTL